MRRLIDADLLKKNCKITGEFDNHFVCVDLVTLGQVVDNQPTVDAVEVVRCKDCMYAFMTIDGEQVKYCDIFVKNTYWSHFYEICNNRNFMDHRKIYISIKNRKQF